MIIWVLRKDFKMNASNVTCLNTTYMKCEELNAIDTTLLSDEQVQIIEIVCNVVMSDIICVIGIIVNIINMVVFFKQGLNNTVNISMFAVSISDVCGLVTLAWHNITVNPFMETADLPFDPSEIPYLTAGWPHACFLQITIWITVYVTAERFICIALPLKVKLIFTPFRTKIFTVIIYFLMFVAVSPEYITLYYGDNFYPARNKTLVGLKERGNREHVKDLVFMLFFIIGIVSFIILITFTALLVVTLNQSSEWRRKSTTEIDKAQAMCRRNRKTMKMVSLIAGVLIVCTSPGMFLSIAAVIVPDFNFDGKHRNVFVVAFSCSFLAEAINSTVNIIFFYKLSTKYKHMCQQLFTGCIGCCHGNGSSERSVPSNISIVGDSTPSQGITSDRSVSSNTSIVGDSTLSQDNG